MSRQTQEGGDGSVNVQAAGDVVVQHGMSYSDVRDIALDVFRSNFEVLSGAAAEIVKARAEEFTENFLNELAQKNPAGLAQAEDPDFQYSLFVAQKEFARSGDADVGELLVQLLVDKTTKEKRSLQRIVLGESLQVAPRLTAEQISILAMVFILRYSKSLAIGSQKMLGEYFGRRLAPYMDCVGLRFSAYQHLEYLGCGSLGMMTQSLPNLILAEYPGLFFEGFDLEYLRSRGVNLAPSHPVFCRCLNDPQKMQFSAVSREVLDQQIEMHGLQEMQSVLVSLYESGRMDEQKIQTLMSEQQPMLVDIFKMWNTSMGALSLTSVGLAIAHASIKGNFSDAGDLSIWI